jgi:nucleoside-diphosphate-sugar epimerase
MSSAMRALVLGATGLAGSALTETLLAKRHEVHALVRRPEAVLPEGVHRHEGDIGDPNTIAVAAKGVDVIFVAVGLPLDAPDERHRWLYVAGTENVLAAARHAEVPRVVLISCADVVLGDEARVHWDEKRDLAYPPIGARARAMKLGEEVALSQSDATLAVTALRPGWLWGPGDRVRLPALVAEARAGGIDLCGDGRNLVATTYVEHLAEAALLAAISPHAPGNAYYVGDPEFLEIREFLGMLSRALGLPAPRTGGPYVLRRLWASLGRGALPLAEVVRRGQPTYFDTQKAMTDLGFEPKVKIDDGMKKLAAWFTASEGASSRDASARKNADPSAASR